MYYSAKNNGFFIDKTSTDVDLSDAIEITDKEYNALLSGQARGKQIVPDHNGIPMLKDRNDEPYVPQQVTRAQGKAGLIKGNLMQSVDDYIESIEDATEKALALVALNDTTHWSRTSPFLNKAAKAIGLTDNDLDNLFIDSAKIEL